SGHARSGTGGHRDDPPGRCNKPAGRSIRGRRRTAVRERRAGPPGEGGPSPGSRLARRADRANRRGKMMRSVQRLEENPCRPRHFRPPPPCAPVVEDERATALLETCRTRLVAAAALFTFVFIVVALRLVEVVALSGGGAESHVGRIRAVAPPPAPVRADIVDRNGRLLATTLDSPSLSADPRQILDADEATRAITSVLPQLNPAELRAKLTSGKSFTWIKRRLTPRQHYEVNRLGIPGLQFEHEERRIYPFGDLASHVVGFCGIDNNGLAGIERALDSTVKGSREPIQLSLDARVQFILHEELQKVIGEFGAKGGAGIIMDVRS